MLFNDELCFAATGDRRAQRVPCRGGDFPGVLCLGLADHSDANGECVSVGALPRAAVRPPWDAEGGGRDAGTGS